MKDFLKFFNQHSNLKFNFFLVLLIIIFIPDQNYYYKLNLKFGKPVVKTINYKLLETSDYPINPSKTPAPNISARSALVIDADSKTILFQKNPDLKLLPASITKIMTALIALEHYPLNEIITINAEDINVIGQTMDLEIDEKITVENLLYGLLVQSANDSAQTLSSHYSKDKKAFINTMNDKAKELNLNNTHFENPIGLDQYGHYTTTHDLALLTSYAMEKPIFKKIVSTIGITISDTDNTIIHELEAINELLGVVPGLLGVKTGWTDLAGECLVTYTNRNNKNIITIVLGSLNRFEENQKLINWAFNHHQWIPLAIHFE